MLKILTNRPIGKIHLVILVQKKFMKKTYEKENS
jgi:hypothetical protein